jgi:GINS complex subunit 1
LPQVRNVLAEMRILFEENAREIEAMQLVTPAVHYRHAAIERNKRCLLAYVNQRAERIREMRWQFGAVLPSDVKASLNETEIAYFSRYSRDLAAYMRSLGDGAGLDITSDVNPPKSLYVEVRCLQDYGELETDDGELIVLTKNTQHHLPRAICEPLIRQGVLQHIST